DLPRLVEAGDIVAAEVAATRDEPFSIRAEGDAGDLFLVPRERQQRADVFLGDIPLAVGRRANDRGRSVPIWISVPLRRSPLRQQTGPPGRPPVPRTGSLPCAGAGRATGPARAPGGP